jgi:DNA repair exonuclease SbcCD ATPase subunit
MREKISLEIEDIRENNKQYAEKQKTIKDWESLFSKIDQTTPSELLDEQELRTRLEALQSQVREQQQEIATIEKENQLASAFNAKIEVVREQTEEFEDQLSKLVTDISSIQAKKANLEILKKAFSTNGLIAYKIENLVKELEEITGAYLAELSDGRFTLNFAISNDKLNVEITDNGNTVDILALSSGEQARVNTATLLGIRKIMNSLSSSRINVLFLDEVISVLDDSGRERLVEVLLEEDLNTYLVSHGWSHPLLEKIEVCKVNEVSEIV